MCYSEGIYDGFENHRFYTVKFPECPICKTVDPYKLEGLEVYCKVCGYMPDDEENNEVFAAAKVKKKTAKAPTRKKAVPLITVFADEGGSR